MDYLKLTEDAWLLLALVFAFGTLNKRTTLKKGRSVSQYTYLILLISTFALINSKELNFSFFKSQLFLPKEVIGLGVNLCGIIFAIYSRIYLGSFWSGRITIKKQHRLIITGPFLLLRHPIYSGILLAQIGAALIQAEFRSLLSVLFLVIALNYRIRFEEEMLLKAFPNEYPPYRKRTKKLLPTFIDREQILMVNVGFRWQKKFLLSICSRNCDNF